jgi:NitT/TauT family transport system ATP-binding protein
MSIEISFQSLTKSFQDHNIFKNIQSQIPPHDFISILGPSGSGKTTLLKIIAGLESATTGQLKFSIPVKQKISYVFQEPQLIPWRSVYENVKLPLELIGTAIDKEKIESILNKVGLLKFKNYFPAQLSGGMKMRASIARALVSSPELLLLDEPFAALDEITRHKLEDELYEIWKSSQMTIFFVTHSVSEAVYLSKKCWLLKNEHIQEIAIPSFENRTTLRLNPEFLTLIEKIKKEFTHEV